VASPNAPNFEQASSRAIRIGMRVAGFVMGLAVAGAGTLAVLGKQSLQPRDALVLLSFLVVGFLFVRFGLTGRQTLPSLPRMALFAIALVFLAMGAYTVFFDSTASFTAKVVSAIVAVLAGGSLAATAALRGRS
jgi:hypothetical protein